MSFYSSLKFNWVLSSVLMIVKSVLNGFLASIAHINGVLFLTSTSCKSIYYLIWICKLYDWGDTAAKWAVDRLFTLKSISWLLSKRYCKPEPVGLRAATKV